MTDTTYSCSHEKLSDFQLHANERLLWSLGAFFVIFGFLAILIVGNEVFAGLSSDNPASYQGIAYKQQMSEQDIGKIAGINEYWKNYKIAEGQSLSVIFKKLNINSDYLREIIKAGGLAKQLKRIKPGKLLKFRYVNDEFAGLEYVIEPAYSIQVLRDGETFSFSEVRQEYEKQLEQQTVTINSSLFLSAQKSGLSDKVTMDLSRIFGWDIDFALDIRKGDKFTVVYHSLHFDGQRIKDGDIIAAEFINRGKVYRAVRYTDPEGRTGYYNTEGENMYKPFLRTPVDFARISSHFGHRKHPVLNKMRSHKGVDYAAPRGTKIKASGEGKIVFRGALRGYGKTVIIDHGEGYRTLYAHLERYNSEQRMGTSVTQGQVIGYVGSSGMATGPHLHYEFLVNGVHKDPLTIVLPAAQPIDAKYLADFKMKTQVTLAMLDNPSNMMLAMNTQ